MRARQIIERQVGHEACLLDDLLDVSRITRGKIRLYPERLDLVPLVRDVAEDARSALEAADLTLDLSLPEGPIWVEGDPTRVTQVASNLLNNAAKFTDRGGHVTVRLAVEPDGQRAAIAVRDTGPWDRAGDAVPRLRDLRPGGSHPGSDPGGPGSGTGTGQRTDRAARGRGAGPRVGFTGEGEETGSSGS
jgi:hypothetical protein